MQKDNHEDTEHCAAIIRHHSLVRDAADSASTVAGVLSMRSIGNANTRWSVLGSMREMSSFFNNRRKALKAMHPSVKSLRRNSVCRGDRRDVRTHHDTSTDVLKSCVLIK